MKTLKKLIRAFQHLFLSACLVAGSALAMAEPITITPTVPFPANAGFSQTLTAIYTVTNNTAIELNGIQDQSAQFNGLPSAITIDKVKSTCGAAVPLNAGKSCTINLTLVTPSTPTELSGYLYEHALPLLFGAKAVVGPIKVGNKLLTVTPTAGQNGSIIPNTPQEVQSGSNLRFNATPDSDYFVGQWLLNGQLTQSGGTVYQLNNITSDHTVSVTFLKKSQFETHEVYPTAGENGTISPETEQDVIDGGELIFTATPNNDYIVGQWQVDGNPVQNGGLIYTLGNIKEDHRVTVSFIPKPSIVMTVTPHSGPNGSISPDVPEYVTPGSSLTFNAMADQGYVPYQWLVDGSPVQTGGSQYILSNITRNHAVTINFISNTIIPTYAVTPSVIGAGGSISPSVKQLAFRGGSLLFTAESRSGYLVKEWLVDNVVVQTGTPAYTLKNIMAPHNVQVSFVTPSISIHTITPQPGANGSTVPYAAYQVLDAANTSIIAKPNPGYGVNQWIDNGVVMPTTGVKYNLSNVTEDHIIKVTFSQVPSYVYVTDFTNGIHVCELDNSTGKFQNCNNDLALPGLLDFATYTKADGTSNFNAPMSNPAIIYQGSIVPSTGHLNNGGSYPVNTPPYMVHSIAFATFNKVLNAYMTDFQQVEKCSMSSEAKFSNCGTMAGPAGSWTPIRVTFATINADAGNTATYAYVADVKNNRIVKCSTDINGNFIINSCQGQPIPNLQSPRSIAFTTIGETLYAYVADNGDATGTNQGAIYQCAVNTDGSLSNCSSFRATKQSNWYPVDIVFQNFNGTKYMYVTEYLETTKKGSVYQCTLGSFGKVGVCQKMSVGSEVVTFTPISLSFFTLPSTNITN